MSDLVAASPGGTPPAAAVAALTAEDAVQLFPTFGALLLLKDAGWKFFPNDGTDALLDGAKVWPRGWRDAIRVNDVNDALGMRLRLPGDRHSADEITWEETGGLEEIVHRLLALPQPEARLAPTRALGRAPQLWTP
ncbi:hypothetical protein [Lentzea cavernae]|nr:hypothetical protein [Lentzea cavernae]